MEMSPLDLSTKFPRKMQKWEVNSPVMFELAIFGHDDANDRNQGSTFGIDTLESGGGTPGEEEDWDLGSIESTLSPLDAQLELDEWLFDVEMPGIQGKTSTRSFNSSSSPSSEMLSSIASPFSTLLAAGSSGIGIGTSSTTSPAPSTPFDSLEADAVFAPDHVALAPHDCQYQVWWSLPDPPFFITENPWHAQARQNRKICMQLSRLQRFQNCLQQIQQRHRQIKLQQRPRKFSLKNGKIPMNANRNVCGGMPLSSDHPQRIGQQANRVAIHKWRDQLKEASKIFVDVGKNGTKQTSKQQQQSSTSRGRV